VNMWEIFELILLGALLIPMVIAFVTGAPFVPTPMARVNRMLELAELKKGDRIYDIGCGDGRMVHVAHKIYGADSVGLELSPLVYFLAKVRQKLWRSGAKILLRDFRGVNLSDAKVIVCYLLPNTLETFREKFLRELRPGTKIISYAFEIKGWKPVHMEDRIREKNFSPIWVYEIGKSH
jgi:SAM-dependent methyltransferase